jgi:hypothetical protein
MSKAIEKKVIDKTESDNYRAGFNYGRLTRAGINAFRELVIAWRTGNLEAGKLLSRKKQNISVISDDVLNVPAFLRKSRMSAFEFEKENLGGFPKAFKYLRCYDMAKTISILQEDGFFDLTRADQDGGLYFCEGENHAICH